MSEKSGETDWWHSAGDGVFQASSSDVENAGGPSYILGTRCHSTIGPGTDLRSVAMVS